MVVAVYIRVSTGAALFGCGNAPFRFIQACEHAIIQIVLAITRGVVEMGFLAECALIYSNKTRDLANKALLLSIALVTSLAYASAAPSHCRSWK